MGRRRSKVVSQAQKQQGNQQASSKQAPQATTQENNKMQKEVVTQSSTTSAIYLPPDIVRLIFGFLRGCDVGKLLRICKEWCTILDDDQSWLYRLQVEFYKQDSKMKKDRDVNRQRFEEEERDMLAQMALMPFGVGQTRQRRKNFEKRNVDQKELPPCYRNKKKYILRASMVINRCAFCFKPTPRGHKDVLEEVQLLVCGICRKEHVANVSNSKTRFCLKDGERKELTRYSFGFFVDEIVHYFNDKFEGGMQDELDRRRAKRDKIVNGHMKGKLKGEIEWRAQFKKALVADATIPTNKIDKYVEEYLLLSKPSELFIAQAVEETVRRYKNKKAMYELYEKETGTVPDEETREKLKQKTEMFSMTYFGTAPTERLRHEVRLIQEQKTLKALLHEKLLLSVKIPLNEIPRICCSRLDVRANAINEECKRDEGTKVLANELDTLITEMAPMIEREKNLENIMTEMGYKYNMMTLPDIANDFVEYGFVSTSMEDMILEIIKYDAQHESNNNVEPDLLFSNTTYCSSMKEFVVGQYIDDIFADRLPKDSSQAIKDLAITFFRKWRFARHQFMHDYILRAEAEEEESKPKKKASTSTSKKPSKKRKRAAASDDEDASTPLVEDDPVESKFEKKRKGKRSAKKPRLEEPEDDEDMPAEDEEEVAPPQPDLDDDEGPSSKRAMRKRKRVSYTGMMSGSKKEALQNGAEDIDEEQPPTKKARK